MDAILVVTAADPEVVGTVWYLDLANDCGILPLVHPSTREPLHFLDWLELCLDAQADDEGGPALIEYSGDATEDEEDYHLLCETCGTMLHFDSEPLRAAFHRFADENALAIDESKLILYGTCPGCVRKRRP